MKLTIKDGGYIHAPAYAWDIDAIRNGSPAAITAVPDGFLLTTWAGLTGFGAELDRKVYPSRAAALRDVAALLCPLPGVYPYGDGSR